MKYWKSLSSQKARKAIPIDIGKSQNEVTMKRKKRMNRLSMASWEALNGCLEWKISIR